jgi:hypothetical protein
MELHHWVTIGLVSAAYLVSVAAFIFGLRAKVAVLQERLRNVEQALSELKEIVWLRYKQADDK